MSFRAAYALTAALAFSGLLISADCADAAPQAVIPQTSSISPATQTAGPPARLTAGTELLLVRYVDGEFAKAVRGIPAGRKGFKIMLGKPVNPQDLSDALRLYGTVANPGDRVQITQLDFDGHSIRVEINGGGRKHFNWRQHLQVGIGNMATPPPDPNPKQPTGGVLIVDFGRQDVPNLSADALKQYLSPFLDFSKHSAAVNWVDALPPKFQKGIKQHQAVVGMNQEMVIAAMGLPDKKVRQWDDQGRETVDWIYGLPPSPSTFVTFASENVIRVKQYAMEDASMDAR
ncbi:MAG TPA: hypothetical protein VNK23_07920 [Candidatus Dormibacteraeota bacterium]|nr:hypothetical protein [Candidatus Dormibacteraeota bacterium]